MRDKHFPDSKYILAMLIAAILIFSISIAWAQFQLELTNGNCNPETDEAYCNVVDDLDWGVLNQAWYSTPSDPNWNEGADLNGDLGVDEIDYAILTNAWYTEGAEKYTTTPSTPTEQYFLYGDITLGDWTSSPQYVVVQAKKQGTSNVYGSTITSGTGIYVQVDSAGTYDIRAKGIYHWLRGEVTGIHTIPTGDVDINSGAIGTSSTSATLTIIGDDYSESNPDKMYLRNEGGSFAEYSFATSYPSWTLTTGEGTKTVYIKFKDINGLESKVFEDTIILDTTNPTPGTAESPAYASDHPFTVTYTGASDSGSGIKEIQLWYKKVTDSGASSWANSGLTDVPTPLGSGSFEFNPPTPTESAVYYFDLKAVDNADNASATPSSGDGDDSTIYEAGLGLCSFSDVIEP